jgi:hypothetical protein
MVPESKLERTDGLVPKGQGWFVLNMRDAVWRPSTVAGAVSVIADDFKGERQFDQLGVNPFVLRPGEPMASTTGRPIRRTSWSSRAKQF